MRRIEEFRQVEDALEPVLESLEKEGIPTSLSVILKTPSEVQQGGLLYLDLTETPGCCMTKRNIFSGFWTGFEIVFAS